jgi:hypothetical protein
MFARLSNSWELLKASARVLMADKELIIFPIISAAGVLLVTLTFALPMLLSSFVDRIFLGGRIEVLGFIVVFLFYVVQYTVIFFANTALVGAALIRLRGGDPTVGDGLRIASSRILPILGYALIAATVGMLLRAISNRSRGIGRMLVSLIGFAWNVATFLVVPVLAVENVGPIEAVKRSANLLKRTWGEQIAGSLGMGAIFTIFTLLVLAVLAPIVILAINTQSAPLIIGTIIAAVLILMIVGLVKSTLEGIYAAAVYQYATTGQAGAFFEERLVRAAFAPSTAY